MKDVSLERDIRHDMEDDDFYKTIREPDPQMEHNEQDLLLFKHKMITKINNMKKFACTMDISRKSTYDGKMDFIVYFLEKEFSTLENFIKHLFFHSKTKEKVNVVLANLFEYETPESKLQNSFEKTLLKNLKFVLVQ